MIMNQFISSRCSVVTTFDADEQQVKAVYTVLLEAMGILGSSQRRGGGGQKMSGGAQEGPGS